MPGYRVVSRYRAGVAVELRLRGLEYADIATELGYASKSGAWMIVNQCLKQRAVTDADAHFAKSLIELFVA